MKRLIVFLVALLVSLSVFAGERVTKIVESDLPVIIDGNWIYPVNGKHTLVLTDSVLTINGYEYVHPPKKTEKHEISKEKDFFSWVIDTAIEKAQKEIDAGRGEKAVQRVMDEFFKKHIGSRESVTYKYDKKNKTFLVKTFLVKEDSFSVPMHVSLPYLSTKERMEGRPTWRKKAVEGECRTLISVLKSGRLLFKNTQDNYSRGFNLEEAIPAIRKIQEERLKYMEAARDTNVWVDGIKFTPTDIKILTNPGKLIKRRFEDESD